MIRRFAVLGAVVAALAVGDLSARAFVETRATERAQLEAPPGSTVSATVGGFPFVPPLLLGGKVSRVGVHIETIDTAVISIARVDLALRGVQLDRNRLLQTRKVRITDIDSGTIEVTITESALRRALNGVPVKIAEGAISVGPLDVTPAITPDGQLTLTAVRRTFRLAIPKLDYVPCFGEITVLAGRLRLSCEIDEVPAALVDAVANASG